MAEGDGSLDAVVAGCFQHEQVRLEVVRQPNGERYTEAMFRKVIGEVCALTMLAKLAKQLRLHGPAPDLSHHPLLELVEAMRLIRKSEAGYEFTHPQLERNLALSYVRDRLEDPSAATRYTAAVLLRDDDDPRVVDSLKGLVREEDQVIYIGAMKELLRRGNGEQELWSISRGASASFLIDSRDDAPPAMLERILRTHPEAFVREWAAMVLERRQTAAKTFIAALPGEDDSIVRKIIVRALGNIGDRRAVPVLGDAPKPPAFAGGSGVEAPGIEDGAGVRPKAIVHGVLWASVPRARFAFCRSASHFGAATQGDA